LFQTLKDKLSFVTSEKMSEDEGETEREEESPLQRVEGSLGDIIALCHRSSQSLNQEQRGVLWFPLLEAMMSPQKLLKGLNTRHTSDVLKELTMKVLNSMSIFIPLPAIIQHILQDPVYGKGKLAEIQGLILGMLETFNYEQVTVCVCSAVSRGLHPRQDTVTSVLQQYKRRQDSPDEIIIFRSSPQHSHQHICLQYSVLIEDEQCQICLQCNVLIEDERLSDPFTVQCSDRG
uniref:Uncharacterized protein n=1 Tax=Salmo trutta TaxID=8032 RepID=A0A674C251_SALTR